VLFVVRIDTPETLALMAVALQLAVEVSRNLNQAVRYSAALEIDMTAIQRLLEFVNLKPEQALPRLGGQLSNGSIEFTNVEMRYSKKLEPALTDLSFRIESGEKVAIVGRTGSGKSSLFQLIQGFRPPFRGQVQIDDSPIESYNLSDLRNALNVVLQSTFVISSNTIAENLDPKQIHSASDLEFAL